jgi:hypothetical protein
MEVRLLYLKTGEQIVASVTAGKDEFGHDGFIVKKPFIIVPHEGRAGLAPWLPYTEMAESGFVKHESISVNPLASIDLKNAYANSSSGIVVPTQEVATPKLQLSE